MDPITASLQDPTFIMANAGSAGVYNLIPGVRDLFTGSYRGSHDGYAAMGAPQEYLDFIRMTAISYGWW